MKKIIPNHQKSAPSPTISHFFKPFSFSSLTLFSHLKAPKHFQQSQNSPKSPLFTPFDHLIISSNQSKPSIYQTWQTLCQIANLPQEAFL